MLKVAKQNELQFIIGKMKGIETASVLYDIQSKKAFGQERRHHRLGQRQAGRLAAAR